jgi:hypothetical protein
MARREYTAGRPTKLDGVFNIGDTTFVILDDTNWPTGADNPFWVTIDAGTAQEERVLCLTQSSKTVTIASGGRGADGTSESNHASGANVWPSWSATDADEANAHVNASTNVHGLATAGPSSSSGGSVVGTSAQQTLTNKTLTSPTITGTITGTGVVSSTNIADGTIVNADINASAAIASTKISGTAATLAGTETLTNKTLTSPRINENVALTATSTFLNRVDATSSIQTQLNGKSATSHSHAFLPLSGGTMTGQLNLADNVALNLGTNGFIDLDDGGYINFSNDDKLSYNDSTNTYSFGADGDADGGAILANEFLTSDNAGSESDPAFASPQGTSGMYFVGGSTITGIRFTVNGTLRYQITSSGGANVSTLNTKDNVETYAVPTEDLLNIRTISYHPKGDERDVTAFGVIAEELDEVPSLRIFLDYEEDGSPISVQYDRIALALINVVKEQQTRIDSLEQRLTALEAK